MNREVLAREELLPPSGERLLRRVVQLILEKKGEDVVVLDVRGRSSYADFIVLASARSARHVQGLAEHVEDELAWEGVVPLGVEGRTEGQWVLMDYGDVVVHLFYGSVRELYDLEGLWTEAPRLDPHSLVPDPKGGDDAP